MFRLNLTDDPIKSWLDEQAGVTTSSSSTTENSNGKSSGPQSISID
ncbi:MAG TPA: hypothetical protein V6D28_22965 [Leptolyngbyaceae cyanobacterium]